MAKNAMVPPVPFPMVEGTCPAMGETVVDVVNQRNKYREVLEIILRRNKMMNTLIFLDLLEAKAREAIGYDA